MKKLILMIVAVLMAFSGIQAQNANRSGFFVELQGGRDLGTVMEVRIDYNSSYDYYHHPYLKGGLFAGLDFGYRFATSTSFAIEGKINMSGNFLDFEKTFNIDITPGVRWTSKDFSSEKSMYVSLNAGFGTNLAYFESMYVPIELGVGCNLTKRFYIGVFLTEKIFVNEGEWFGASTIYDSYNYSIGDCYYYNKNHTSAGIKVGYRF